jgi:hypothetical protein
MKLPPRSGANCRDSQSLGVQAVSPARGGCQANTVSGTTTRVFASRRDDGRTTRPTSGSYPNGQSNVIWQRGSSDAARRRGQSVSAMACKTKSGTSRRQRGLGYRMPLAPWPSRPTNVTPRTQLDDETASAENTKPGWAFGQGRPVHPSELPNRAAMLVRRDRCVRPSNASLPRHVQE